MARILAVAHQTAETRESVAAIKAAAEAEAGTEFVLLVPATHVTHLATWTEGESHAVAAKRASTARSVLEQAGVKVAEVRVGDADPYQAVMDALAGGRFDGIIVSTFPPGISRWLGVDLINRLRHATNISITHLVAR
jgi:hypothetical protein